MHLNRLSNTFHLVNLAQQAKRLPHIIVAIVMTLVIIIVGIAIGEIAIIAPLKMLIPWLDDAPAANAMTGAIQLVVRFVAGFGVPTVLLWVWLKFYEGRPFSTIGLESAGAIKKFGRGWLIGVGMFGATVLVMAALGFVAFEPGDPQQQGLAVLGAVLFTLLGWTVQGSFEEMLTRGWLMPVISARYNNIWLGVIVSSAFFSILHFLNPNINVIAALNIFIVGVFFALFALWEEGIWGVCGIHVSWNWAQGNLFGFEVSGSAVSGGILMNLMETGPGLITGDAFGPEAGLAASFVLILSVIAALFLLKRQVAPAIE